MKSVFILAAATVAALGVLVALPVAFVVLQAVFPRLAEGSLGDPFGAWGAVLSQPGTLALVGGTLKLGLSVAAVSAAIGIPLGAARPVPPAAGAAVGPAVPHPLPAATVYRGAVLDHGAATARFPATAGGLAPGSAALRPPAWRW